MFRSRDIIWYITHSFLLVNRKIYRDFPQCRFAKITFFRTKDAIFTRNVHWFFISISFRCDCKVQRVRWEGAYLISERFLASDRRFGGLIFGGGSLLSEERRLNFTVYKPTWSMICRFVHKHSRRKWFRKLTRDHICHISWHKDLQFTCLPFFVLKALLGYSTLKPGYEYEGAITWSITCSAKGIHLELTLEFWAGNETSNGNWILFLILGYLPSRKAQKLWEVEDIQVRTAVDWRRQTNKAKVN